MVLENSSGPVSEDSFSENPPPSDDDPYSSSSTVGGTSSYHIDRSNFPKPFPILGPLFGYNDKLFATVLQRKIDISSKTIQRPITSEEANAMAYWVAKNIAVSSYGTPLGIAGGLWRAYNSAHEFRFPFYRPNLEMLQARLLARGPRYVLLLHAARVITYGFVGKLVGEFFFGSYGTSVSVVGELRDPRVKDLLNSIASKSKERRNLPAARTDRPVSPVGGAGTPDGRDQAQDDASPTGGMFADSYESADMPTEEAGVLGAGKGVNSKTLGKTGAAQQIPEKQRRPDTYGPQRTRPPPAPEEDDEPFDAFDDSSASSSSTGGSAWDRLRRGEKPSAPPKTGAGWQAVKKEQSSSQNAWAKQQRETQREQREGSSLEDSFAFSKTEEERAYAKEEAQREFDARVERERRGGDFSSGGDQKRW